MFLGSPNGFFKLQPYRSPPQCIIQVPSCRSIRGRGTTWWYVPYITLQNSALLFPSGLGGSGFDLLHLGPRALDLFDDVLNRGGPDERLGVFVPGLHKCLDRLL